MKRILPIALGLSVIFSLSACDIINESSTNQAIFTPVEREKVYLTDTEIQAFYLNADKFKDKGINVYGTVTQVFSGGSGLNIQLEGKDGNSEFLGGKDNVL